MKDEKRGKKTKQQKCHAGDSFRNRKDSGAESVDREIDYQYGHLHRRGDITVRSAVWKGCRSNSEQKAFRSGGMDLQR